MTEHLPNEGNESIASHEQLERLKENRAVIDAFMKRLYDACISRGRGASLFSVSFPEASPGSNYTRTATVIVNFQTFIMREWYEGKRSRSDSIIWGVQHIYDAHAAQPGVERSWECFADGTLYYYGEEPALQFGSAPKGYRDSYQIQEENSAPDKKIIVGAMDEEQSEQVHRLNNAAEVIQKRVREHRNQRSLGVAVAHPLDVAELARILERPEVINRLEFLEKH